jgi:hypothetical protein
MFHKSRTYNPLLNHPLPSITDDDGLTYTFIRPSSRDKMLDIFNGDNEAQIRKAQQMLHITNPEVARVEMEED